MNHREPPISPVGRRRGLRFLAILLLPGLTPKTTHSLPRARLPIDRSAPPPVRDPMPHLPVVGPPPLRFERPAPPPDLVTHPAASAPPIPALTPTETTVAQANVTATQSTPPVIRATTTDAPPPPRSDASPPAKPVPPAILPDDTRSPVRPEDFLPFFQIPGSARSPGAVNVIAPAVNASPNTAPVPPSSATYTQTPR